MATLVPTRASRPAARRFHLSISPTPWLAAAEGAGRGALLASVLVTGLISAGQGVLPTPLLSFALYALLAFLFFFAFEGIAVLLWKVGGWLLGRLRAERPRAWLARVRPETVSRLVATFFVLFGRTLWPDSLFKYTTATAADGLLIAASAVAGALLGLAWSGRRSERARTALGASALIPLALAGAWLAWPGSAAGLIAPLPAAPVAPLALPDPGLPGPFAVATLSYGSGTDARPEYGRDAALVTAPVDGTAIYAGEGALADAYVRWRWGFDRAALPLNGRVWYPEGAGPFPLVLIVHGNHDAFDASEPGYAYLGEHLASHGYLVASVDENFLNGAAFYDGGGREIPLRGWLLLKHLQAWRAWNDDPASPFFGKVDLGAVALIGHSRGGEAVAHAAVLNERPYAPVSEVSAASDFGFGIRAVVSLAPSDSFYKPQGRPITLTDVSYLTIAGAHDADAYKFWGLAQYGRTRLTGEAPEAFKAAAFLYRANHGQFNSVWRYGDRGRWDWLVLNRAALVPLEAQQDEAKTLVSAFLHAALRGEAGYRALFAAPDRARAWLPEGEMLVTRYQEASYLAVDENRTLAPAARVDVPGGELRAEGMDIFAPVMLQLRDGETSQHDAALRLTWAAGARPALAYRWPASAAGAWALSADDALTLALGSARDDYAVGGVTLVLEDGDGARARLPLARFATIPPPFVAEPVKTPWLMRLFGVRYDLAWRAERVLQTVQIPLAAFVEAEPALRLDALAGLRIEFDGATAGELYVDEVGFHRETGAR